MAMVLNQSGRSIYTQITERDGESKRLVVVERFAFHPGQLTPVDDNSWKILKKQKAISELLDKEELISGSRAERKGGSAQKEITETDNKAKDQADK